MTHLTYAEENSMKKRWKGLLALWLAFIVTVLSPSMTVSAIDKETGMIHGYIYHNNMDDLKSYNLWDLNKEPHTIYLDTPLDTQLDISDFMPYAGHIQDGWILWGFYEYGVVEGCDRFYTIDGTITQEEYDALTDTLADHGLSKILFLPSWKCKYEITHQPLPAEPYISTNEPGSYQWYLASMDDYGDTITVGPAVPGQTSNVFTGGTGSYVCKITYDDYALTSDLVTITEHAITREEAKNGAYTLSVNGKELTSSFALSGQTVMVTPVPSPGYVLDKITVTAADDSKTAVTVDRNGCFTMPDHPVTVQVSFTEQTFEITLPGGAGYLAAVADGQVAPVFYGGSYSFTITIADGYTASDSFAVTANGRTLAGTSTDGRTYTYTITDITEAQTVSVAGVTLVPASEPEPPANTDVPANTDTPAPDNTPANTDTPANGAPVAGNRVGNNILSGGILSLASGTAYQLGNGKWTVAGDSTIYEGGSVFYVTSSGSYNFHQQ